MKTKSVVMALAIVGIVGWVGSAQAQHNAQTVSTIVKTVKVNVLLQDVIAIGSGAANGEAVQGEEVNFSYTSAKDYSTDQSQEKSKLFSVTSTKPYVVNVKSNAENFAGKKSENTLDMKILKVSIKKSGAAQFSSEVSPSTTDQKLLSDESATINQTYDVKYAIPVNQTVLTATKDTYSTTLTFSVTAK